MTKEELKRLTLVATTYQYIYPSNSCCAICGLPWPACKIKSIMLTEYHGVFYVCTYCWDNSTLDQIINASLKGYRSQFDSIRGTKHEKQFLEDHSLIDILEKVREEYERTHNQQWEMDKNEQILQDAIVHCKCSNCAHRKATGEFSGVSDYCGLNVREKGVDRNSIDKYLQKDKTPYWCPVLIEIKINWFY